RRQRRGRGRHRPPLRGRRSPPAWSGRARCRDRRRSRVRTPARLSISLLHPARSFDAVLPSVWRDVTQPAYATGALREGAKDSGGWDQGPLTRGGFLNASNTEAARENPERPVVTDRAGGLAPEHASEASREALQLLRDVSAVPAA